MRGLLKRNLSVILVLVMMFSLINLSGMTVRALELPAEHAGKNQTTVTPVFQESNGAAGFYITTANDPLTYNASDWWGARYGSGTGSIEGGIYVNGSLTNAAMAKIASGRYYVALSDYSITGTAGMTVVIGGTFYDDQNVVTFKKTTYYYDGTAWGAVDYGEVWSAPSTVKIAQNDTAYSNKGAAELSYEAVRNEYESRQLFITASQKVDSFELIPSDLVCGTNVLSADNVEVYVEKYIPITSDSAYTTSGYMPDALLPMEAAAAYGENAIAANQNGGLWITIYVSESTAAGTYTGTFDLVMRGDQGQATVDVPVSVKVHNYILPAETTAKTLFVWRYNDLAAGELDGSTEMMTYYYDFFQNYRISLHSLPLETLSGKEYADMVVKYYDSCSTYTLLSNVGAYDGAIFERQDKIIEQILAVAEASSREKKNYFDKAVIYYIDEPNITQEATRNDMISQSKRLYKVLEESVALIENDTSGLYSDFKNMSGWKAAILEIPNIVPLASYTEWLYETEELTWLEKLQGKTPEPIKAVTNFLSALTAEGTTNICFCPLFDTVDYTDSKDQVRVLCQKYGIGLWWYGCLGPVSPNPSYHILDKNLLSARTVTWLQKKYNVGGNLYWDAAAYTSNGQYIDLYETGNRTGGVAGDGFLVYPGKKYGVYGPIPSMRLMSIRDGMEEYEILSAVEGVVSNMNNTFYSKIVSKVSKMYADGENSLNFDALRSTLLSYTDQVTPVPANSDSSAVSYRFDFSDNMSVTQQKDDGNTKLLFSFESYADITGTAFRTGNQLGATKINKDQKYISEGDGSWLIKPQGDYGRGDAYPYFVMQCTGTSTFTTSNFNAFDKLIMDAYNDSDEAVRIKLDFTVLNSAGERVETEPAYFTLAPKTWTACEYSLTDPAYSSYFKLDDVKYMKVTFLTKKDGKDDTVPELYLDNMRGHYGTRRTDTYTYDFEEGVSLENMLERNAFVGNGTNSYRLDISRISYADAGITPRKPKFGEYLLTGVATEARWPELKVNFGKTYKAGSALSFWMYIDVDDTAAAGKNYWVMANAGQSSCSVTADYTFNNWTKVNVILAEDTDNIQILLNFNVSGGYSSDFGQESVHVYMDDFKITVFGTIGVDKVDSDSFENMFSSTGE